MKHKKFASTMIFLMILFLTSGFSLADEDRDKDRRKYKVTITNLTRGQVFSNPIVIVHNRNFNLFTLGEKAGDELVALAEGGNAGPLADLIEDLYPKAHSVVAGGPVMPGASESVTLEISKRGRSSLISVAGMLVTTNDAFFAVRDIWFLGQEKVMMEAVAYDAGSERNSENCDFIPGPPCGNSPAHDPADSEGYVHIHAGVHGIDPEGEDSSLNPAEHDWRNPVAKITIRRIYY